MKRKIIAALCSWFNRPDRKPLVLRGARQVGKTWIVRYLAKKLNLDLLELNFEQDISLKTLFITNNPKQTIIQLEGLFNKTINLQKTILFLDEIQAAPELLAKLRWFAEELPELAIIATGSLLDFILAQHEFSMPVGRINYFYLEPMSFEEFLLASGQEKLYQFLINYTIKEQISQAMHQHLWKFLQEYMLVGGMPAAVKNWIENHSLQQVSEIQQNILATYRDDFNKYTKRIARERLEETFRAIPHLIGKKFKYSAINKEAHSTTIKNALNLLCQARVCHKVHVSAANGIPLAAEIKENIFKVILLDVGLVSAAMGLTLTENINLNRLSLINKGQLAEQLAGQLLRSTVPNFLDPKLYYWIREKTGSSAELDYLIEHNMEIFPIEVKSGSTGTLRSLHTFMKVKNLNKSIRLNADLPSILTVTTKNHLGQSINYRLLSLPLYLTEQIYRLIDTI